MIYFYLFWAYLTRLNVMVEKRLWFGFFGCPTALTLPEPWLDLAFLAFGESTAAFRAEWDDNVKDEAGVRPTSPAPGPPRRWPPPEKGMKADAQVAEKEGVDGAFSPDGPASSPSSLPLTTGGGLCSTWLWDAEASSCWSGSVLVAKSPGGTWVSNGPRELGFWSGTSGVDAGTDGRASSWGGGLHVISLAGGVVGVAAGLVTSVLSSSFWVLLLIKYLKIDIHCFITIRFIWRLPIRKFPTLQWHFLLWDPETSA